MMHCWKTAAAAAAIVQIVWLCLFIKLFSSIFL
jgi:hypothetical protein